jgi:predicted RNase H-like nuclease (RuvC/YqgF family)
LDRPRDVGQNFAMSSEQPEGESDLQRQQRQIDDLRRHVTRNRADIDSLQERADESNHRADVSEARSAEDRRRIGDLETHVDVDRAMILELQHNGLISEKHAENLQVALHSSRRIGAAIGIIMANRNVTETNAFLMLSKASQNANRKVHILADEIVDTGDVALLGL